VKVAVIDSGVDGTHKHPGLTPILVKTVLHATADNS